MMVGGCVVLDKSSQGSPPHPIPQETSLSRDLKERGSQAGRCPGGEAQAEGWPVRRPWQGCRECHHHSRKGQSS